MTQDEFDHRCPGCFDEKEETPVCPHCGYDESQQRSPLVLPHRTLLSNRYLAGRVLGKPGGFGITYLGLNTALEELVAVKEYLPRELAARETDQETIRAHSDEEAEQFQYGLDRFIREARMLAQFDHANIVGVRDFFEANGTAYLVMDYYEGKTLKQYLQGQPEKRMDPEIATEIMLRVLDGLKEVHAEGYLHRDIKPSNIYLTQEGRPILIDFGAARLALGEKSRSLSVVMTEGYAPYEQYRREGDQGPWTDVYGAGATLYRMVTGEKPPSATDRVVDDTLRPPHEVNSEVPEELSRAITNALATGNKERPESAEALQDRFRAGLHGGSAEQEKNEPRQRQESSRGPVDASEASTEPAASGADNGRGAETSTEDNGAPWPSVLIGVLVVAALGLGGVAVALYPSGEGAADQDTEQTADAGPPSGPEQPSSSDPSLGSADRSRTEQLLEEARGHLDAGRLTRPEGTNALSAVQQALEQDPGSEEAQQLLGRIADRLVEKGAAAREEGNLQAASSFFERSLRIESQPKVRDELESVRGRIQEQEKYERLLSEVRSTLNEEAPKASELEAAAGAAREAQKLRPESREVKKLLNWITSRAVELGQDAEGSSRYQEAGSYYESVSEIRKYTDQKINLVEDVRRVKYKNILRNVKEKMDEGEMSEKEIKEAKNDISAALSYDSENEEARALLRRIKSMQHGREFEITSSGRGLIRQAREALGGTAFNGIESMRVVTKQQGTESTLVVRLPDQLRTEVSTAMGSITVVNDGETMKMKTPKGTRTAPPSARGQIMGQLWRSLPYLMANLDHDDLTVTALGDTTVEGTSYQQARVKPPAGSEYTLYLSAETMRPERLTLEQTNPQTGQQVQVTQTFADFRTVSGVRLPFTTETVQSTGDGENTVTATIQSLDINTELEDGLFTLE
ncbi:serine/threonine protein kinase [Salinibacter ruber]|uniref:serine/threonine protein kinase n=1 Tax=Salinibacter ruber TaxID=146919 RepID=UPI0020747ABA|nr:protein kinase [Salinibacter ruber]